MAKQKVLKITWVGNYLLEFGFKAESYYSGKWHKKQGCVILCDFLSLGQEYRDFYDRKIYRLLSWEYVSLSYFGRYHCPDFVAPGKYKEIRVIAENVQRLHEIFTEAGRSDLILELLRYLGIDQDQHLTSFRL